jgi:hypothetical protein
MESLAFRVMRRYAARPVGIDKKEIARFVTHELVPDVLTSMERRHPQDMPLGAVNHIANRILTVEAADGRSTVDVLVSVRSRPSNAKGTILLGGGFGSLEKKPVIILELNGAYTPAEIQSERVNQPLWSCTSESCLAYSLYSILIHEATHAADSVVVKERPSAKNPNKSEIPDPNDYSESDYRKYINHPSEVRAWMQQVVDETPIYAKMDGIRGRAQSKSNPNQELVNMALRLSTTWKLVEKHLTSSNKAKILKAVYYNLERLELLF